MLGWLIMAVVIGAALWVVVGPFVRDPRAAARSWADGFRDAPVCTVLTVLALVGIVLFFGAILSFGRLAFDVPTPWGRLKSFWLGGMLALLALPAFFFQRAERRHRRKRLGDRTTGVP